MLFFPCYSNKGTNSQIKLISIITIYIFKIFLIATELYILIDKGKQKEMVYEDCVGLVYEEKRAILSLNMVIKF